ncbi:O-antigen ligase family protein [Thalassospira alkalitolerans]|uniref:O-antigen ligase family protein n=1 Tax=Thalassospira alkalitolerans TaxID=1293890 RepID=UPI003AA910FF
MISANFSGAFERRMHLAATCFLCLIPAFLLFARGAADGAVVLIALLFLVRSAVHRDWSWVREADIAVLLVIWLIMNLLVSPFAEFTGKSFGRSASWLRFVVFYAAVTRWVLADQKAIRAVCMAFLATIMIAAADALYQFFAGYSLLGGQHMNGRLTGPLDRPNIGIYLAKTGFATMTLAFALYVADMKQKAFRVGIVVLAFALMIVFLSGERTASVLSLLAIGCGLVGLFLVGGKSRLAAMGVAVLVLGGVGTLLTVSDRIFARAMAIGNVVGDYSGSIYGELSALGWRLFTEHPVTGTGMGNFGLVCPDYRAEGVIRECHPHPHNFYIEWLSDTGLVGTLPWLVFVAIIVWAGVHHIRNGSRQSLVAGLYLGTLVLSFFPMAATQSAFSNWPAILAWNSIAVAVAALRLSQGRTRSSVNSSS